MFARRTTLSRIAAFVIVALAAAPGYADPPSAPANDNFANATLVSTLPLTEIVDFTLATPETNEDLCSAAVRTVWYKLTPATELDVRASASGGEVYNPYLTLLRETPDGPAPIRTCTSAISATLAAGETYYLQAAVQAFETPTATISIENATGITGRVTNIDGEPILDVCVEAESDDPDLFYPYGFALTNANGEYKMLDLIPSDYRVVFFPCANEDYAWEWYDDAYDRNDADIVTVVAGATTSGIDAVLEAPAIVTGTITSGGEPIESCVRAVNANGGAIGYGYSGSDGAYNMAVGGGGDIKVRFGCEFQTLYRPEWYDDVADEADATVLNVQQGGTLSGIDADLAQRAVPANDMFANAEAVASLPFSATVDTSRAGAETGEPAPCGTTTSRTVWYSFTPDRDGMVVINTRGSTSAAVLGVYTGDIDDPLGLHTVACNHHSMRGGDQIGFNAEQGVKYFVQLGPPFTGIMSISIDWAFGVTPLTYNAPTPCAALCPYWANPPSESQAEREATCAENPSTIAGSWSDVTVTVPDSVEIAGTSDSGVPTELVFTLSPAIDHDSWICRATPDDEGNRYIASGANTTSDRCVVGPIGCEEQVTIPVVPGESVILRVYNWADTEATPAASYGYKVARP